jgi:hypothetical protein
MVTVDIFVEVNVFSDKRKTRANLWRLFAADAEIRMTAPFGQE